MRTSRLVLCDVVNTNFAHLGTDMKQLDSKLGVACRSLSADDFAAVLDLIFDGLSLQGGLSTKDVASLIRLSCIVLHDAPEGESPL